MHKRSESFARATKKPRNLQGFFRDLLNGTISRERRTKDRRLLVESKQERLR